MSRHDTMHRSDLFGFVPQDAVLDAEEAYGDYDPQNWHQRRGGPVVAAEEAYGGDWDPRRGGQVLDSEEEYSFTLSPDEDSDVEFGADNDLDDVPLFSESFGDDSDDQLDSILSQMDAEEGFGQDNLALAPGLEQYREQLATVIKDGVRNAFIGESEGIQSMFRTSAEWVSDKFESMTAPGDMEEIAQAMLADPGFCDWNNLSDADRESLVHNAIWFAAWPGIDLSVDDKLWDAWNAGVTNLPSSAFAVAKAALTGDLPKIVHAAFAEHPVIGNMMQAAGWDPQNADQLRNERAMALWLLGKFGVPVDAYVARAITDQGQDVIAACQAGGRSAGPTDIVEERMVDEFVAPPVQEISDGGMSMPAPEQILAFGYGFTVLGSLAGFFS